MLLGNLRHAWDAYDIWMVREETIAEDKKELFEKDLKVLMREKWNSRKYWPEYIFEETSAPKYIYFSPLKKYGSLDACFEDNPGGKKKLRDLYGVESSNNTIFQRFPCGGYLPKNSYSDWFRTPHLHYWVVSLKNGGQDAFETHMAKLVTLHSKLHSPFCFRTWRVVFGTDLPKYVVVLFAKDEQALEEHASEFDLFTPSVQLYVRFVKEGEGQLRKNLMKGK